MSPTVGIYVDDVPYGSSTAFTASAQLALDVGLFDMSRVEILRGPQGTLYGASTMGGLVKYVTNVPDTKSFGGTVASQCFEHAKTAASVTTRRVRSIFRWPTTKPRCE